MLSRMIRASLAGGLACLLVAHASSARAHGPREVNVIPIAGGDSDLGIGGGAVGDIAELTDERPGFRWRLEAAAFVTFKEQEGSLIVPSNDDYLELLVPRVGPEGRLHVDARLSFTDERTLKYTGLGNASPPLPGDVRLGEYRRLHPTASLEVRARIARSFFLLAGTAFTYNRISVGDGTILARDLATGPPDVRAQLGSFAPHGVELLTVEAQIDTRDDEIITQSGQFHTLRFRLSPHVGAALPYGYERLTGTARFYATPSPRWLSFKVRLVGDLLWGEPPFYELSRFDETPALGGGKAVRGVPAQRYYGKVKVFGNFEAVSQLVPFTLKKKHLMLGVAAFFDAGRTW
ncbi:MAG: hypothetical protein JWM82_2686, partial [Myxococcales bacterium]|nr:hypothetical protein [Myxococcales bacterium]